MKGAGLLGQLSMALLAIIVAAEMPPDAALAQSGADTPTPEPPRAEPVKRLRLMLLDMAELRLPDETSATETSSAGFRHTFGSQRRTNEESEPITFVPEVLEPDVAVLSGLGNMRAARRLFPARDWRLLQARTSPADKVGGPAKKLSPAVAMFLQPGVRFGGADPGVPAGFGAGMRMMSGLGTLWVLSPQTPCQAVATGEAAGGACQALEGWLGARSATSGDLALVGGLMPVPSGGAPLTVKAIPRPGPQGALLLAPRRLDGRLLLTGADARGQCASHGSAHPTMVIAAAKAKLDQLQVAGYVLPLNRPRPPPGPASRPLPPAPPPACVLMLDIALP